MELLVNISIDEIIEYCFSPDEIIEARLLKAHRKLPELIEIGYNNESISIQCVQQEINVLESILKHKENQNDKH